jgi:serine/threonine protein phosphatase PrpC
VAGRASIVGAAATHVGKVREHNEDAHFFDAVTGVFLVCDGMGGHAAGEVASAIAIRTIRHQWLGEQIQQLIDGYMESGSPDVKRQLLGTLRGGVTAAHDAIIGEARQDLTKKGMGTTLVGAVIVGNELVFAHAGDSRAYMVRDGIAMQLTEDHTLLARLLAAGIDVDQSGEGSRFKSMLTNALGIGEECKVSTFVVPLADGDRFLLCSDGISEYVPEHEVGEVLSKQPSPARAAQKLIELALERGGADNATAIVVRVLEAGETPQPAESIKRDDEVIKSCGLWGSKVTPQQRLRALRIAIPRDHAIGERLPAYHLGDRVAWIVIEGKVVQAGAVLEAGTLLYPESLVTDSQAPDRDGLAVARTDVRALALRADDFRELCEDDTELAEVLLETLTPLISDRAQVLSRARADRADTEYDPELQQAMSASHVTRDAPDAPAPAPRPRRAQSPVSMELEERFDAVTSSTRQESRGQGPIPGAEPAAPAPMGERQPLILSPRASSDSIRPKTHPADAALSAMDGARTHVPRPPTEPEIEVLELESSMMKQRAPTPLPRTRPPTAPEIETVIEIEADEGEPDAEPAPVESIVRVIEGQDARVVETITDTSSQTLTVTVTEEPEPEVLSSAERPKRLPSDPVTSEVAATASGTIGSNGAPRAKRTSDGWDD